MPLVINEDSHVYIEFGDFVEEVRSCKPDRRDPNALIGIAPLFARLHGNRHFLADFFENYLLEHLNRPERARQTGQVFSVAQIDPVFYVRACIWPAASDESFKKTGPDLFYYHEPHDHNFNFLTLGYDGPGYTSHYYTINTDTSLWHPGSAAELNDVGVDGLTPGKIMLYRKGIDVHTQFPPERTSISINVMQSEPEHLGDQQHIFSRDMNSISYVNQQRMGSAFFTAALGTRSPRALDLTTAIALHHRNPYVQLDAIKALIESSEIDAACFAIEKCRQSSNTVLNSLIGRYEEAILEPIASCCSQN